MRKIVKWILILIFILIPVTIGYYIFLPGPVMYANQNPELTSFMKMRLQQAKEDGVVLRIKHIYVPERKISTYFKEAVRISEDAGFYQHNGFDLYEIRKSLQENFKKGEYQRGGSTISQQLIKNIFLTSEKSILRKFKEALLTLKLESQLPKKRIFELYLNYIEFGKGIFGAEAASQIYFHHSADSLSLFESVRLAAIIPSPLKWNPVRPTQILKRKSKIILDRLHFYKKIDDVEYNHVLEEFDEYFKSLN